MRITREKDLPKHQRRLQVEGRFYDAMGQWIIEYNPETRELTNLGEHEEDDDVEAKSQTVLRIRDQFELHSVLKLSDLYELMPELSKSTIRRTLTENPAVFEKAENLGRGQWQLVA